MYTLVTQKSYDSPINTGNTYVNADSFRTGKQEKMTTSCDLIAQLVFSQQKERLYTSQAMQLLGSIWNRWDSFKDSHNLPVPLLISALIF